MSRKHDSHEQSSHPKDRREFLMGSAAVAGALMSGGLAHASTDPRTQSPPTDTTGRVASGNIYRMLGALEVCAIGLGCMSMKSSSYNPPYTNAEMIPVIRGAVDRGVTFFDTAEVYGPFTDEELVGEALAPVRNQVVIATKFGFDIRGTAWSADRRTSRPEDIRRAVEGSLRRLRTDRIDLLYQHRVDPQVPVEEVAGTVKDLVQVGKVLHFGLSEASPATLRRAHAVHPVAAVQSQYSLIERVHEHDSGILKTCEELGVGFVAYCPLERGLLTDRFTEWSRFAQQDSRSGLSFFQPETFAANMPLLALVREWALRKGATPAQFSLAWLLAEKPWIVPIPGTTRLHHLNENLGALRVDIAPDERKAFRAALSRIVIHGARAPQAALLDE